MSLGHIFLSSEHDKFKIVRIKCWYIWNLHSFSFIYFLLFYNYILPLCVLCVCLGGGCRYLVIVIAGANRGMTVGRSVLIIILRKTFAARFWYLRCSGLATSLCGTPWGLVEIVGSSNHFVNAAAFELKYCMPTHDHTRDKNEVGVYGLV